MYIPAAIDLIHLSPSIDLSMHPANDETGARSTVVPERAAAVATRTKWETRPD